MRSRFSPAICFLLVSAAVLFIARASAQDIFVTPIPGAPFSGVINVERTIIRGDGSVENVKTMREIGRDSQGRIHNEMRALMPISSNTPPPLIRIHLYDPQTRESAMLDAQRKRFWVRTVNRPPATVPPALIASPTGGTLPQNDYAKQEDLGVHEINGVLAHGVRQVQTIPEGNGGKGIVVTDEYWYSEELRINLVVKHSDPHSGSVTMTVDQISRTEPDPAFFEIPNGYQEGDPQDGR
ncbi:MAG TPA: hypothetical protein VMB66_02825 [Candidatus Acidoferrales bacterium]|nr:hypothetical protein [Candidatus Acidoferrales bacterium]